MALSTVAQADLRQDFTRLQCDQVIDKRYYQVCYDYQAKGAKAVFYTLDGAVMNQKNIKKRPRFYPEKRLPKVYRTYSSDYTRNPYHADRGHLAPDAAFDWSVDSLHSVYSMANIIPQYYMINRKSWQKAERLARKQAVRYHSAQVLNLVDYGDYRTKFPRSNIAVPYSFTKIIEAGGQKTCLRYINDAKHYKGSERLKDHRIPCP